MATWEVTVGSNTYPIAEVSITKSLSSLNNADFVTTVSLALDTEVTIKYNGSTVFMGYIKNRTETEDKLYRYTVIEKAVELETQIVKNGTGSYVFTLTNQTVDDIISTILSDTDWTAGSSDNSTIQAISFAYTNKLTALFKVLREIKGYYVWFDNLTRKVYWGTSRTDQGTIDYIKKEVEEETYKRIITKVIVFGNEEDIYGEAGSDETAVAIYKYADAKTPEECTLVANTILSELQNPYHRISITTTVNPNINEGDLVTVDGSSYVVQEINMDMYEMRLDLNARRKSIFEVLGGKLTEMSGTVKVGKKVTSTYDGGWSFVSSSTPSKYTFVIDDVNNIEDFTLEVKLDNFKKLFATGTEYANIDISDTTIVADNLAATTGLQNQSSRTDIDIQPLSAPAIVTRESEYSSGSGASLPFSYSWDADSGFGNGNGHAFSVVFVSVHIQNTSIYDTVEYITIQIYYWDGYSGTWKKVSEVSHAIDREVEHHTITGVAIVPGDSYYDNKVYKVEVTSTYNSIFKVWLVSTCTMFVARHDHPYNDPYHSHDTDEDPHNHIFDQDPHDHIGDDLGHNPNVSPDYTYLTEYPSSVSIKVNGNTVGTMSGGAAETASFNIKQYLVNGTNTIEISPSSGKGSVYVSGKYTHLVFS